MTARRRTTDIEEEIKRILRSIDKATKAYEEYLRSAFLIKKRRKIWF